MIEYFQRQGAKIILVDHRPAQVEVGKRRGQLELKVELRGDETTEDT